KFGETLVVDWGLAKVKGRDEQHKSSEEHTLVPRSGSGAPTQDGSAIGTPSFMSPEQAAGQLEHLRPASDVYSLGATLYYILTHQPPFNPAEDVVNILSKVQRGEFPIPRAVK